jgi:hypothetical protein
MFRNCSTRDGQSRVLAPKNPHLLWETKLPIDGSGVLGVSSVFTGGAADAYVVTTSLAADKGAVHRLRTADGVVEWSLDVSPDQATQMPVLRAGGTVELYARDAASTPAVLSIEATTGAVKQTTTYGFDLSEARANPAVGGDGSLYFVHAENGDAGEQVLLSWVAPDGTPIWTRSDLAALAADAGVPVQAAAPLALADGKIVVTLGVGAPPNLWLGFFEPLSGAFLGGGPTPEKVGALLGGPAVLPDSRVAVLTTANTHSLALLTTTAWTFNPLSFAAVGIYGVTTSGVVIVGVDEGNGPDGLAALATDVAPGGNPVLWKRKGPFTQATIALDGTILAFGPTFSAIDPETGASIWDLPVAAPCLMDAALASDGTIVGLRCDGTVFAVGD